MSELTGLVYGQARTGKLLHAVRAVAFGGRPVLTFSVARTLCGRRADRLQFLLPLAVGPLSDAQADATEADAAERAAFLAGERDAVPHCRACQMVLRAERAPRPERPERHS